jgi:hypothetical protein
VREPDRDEFALLDPAVLSVLDVGGDLDVRRSMSKKRKP